jgi:hypothetical protein
MGGLLLDKGEGSFARIWKVLASPKCLLGLHWPPFSRDQASFFQSRFVILHNFVETFIECFELWFKTTK